MNRWELRPYITPHPCADCNHTRFEHRRRKDGKRDKRYPYPIFPLRKCATCGDVKSEEPEGDDE